MANIKKIHVFKDHECWDTHRKWWMVPQWLSNELYVTTIVYEGIYYPLTEECEEIIELRKEFPGMVLVY